MRGVREELVEIYYREQKRELSKCAAVGQDICISVFEGLSLEEYVDVRSSVCSTTHKQPCKNCCGLLQVANLIYYYLFGANIYMNIFKCALQVTLK